MIKVIFLLAVSILMVNCSDSSTNEVENNKAFNTTGGIKEFNICLGDSINLSDLGIIIKFKSVESDSRCPIDAICIWEGNAEIVLGLKSVNGDTISTNLNTSLEPRSVVFSDLTIVLKNLVPYPKLNTVINPSNYSSKLSITNKEN